MYEWLSCAEALIVPAEMSVGCLIRLHAGALLPFAVQRAI